MPRPLKTRPNALRQLRIITGLSQKAFAKLTGLNVETIKSAECRGKSLSHNSVRLIAQATGVSPVSVKGDGPLLTHIGLPYNASVWNAWRTASNFSDEAVDREARWLAARVFALICAANKDGRFLPTVAAIRELILGELAKPKLKFKSAYAEHLKAATASKRAFRYTVGDLRRKAAAAKTIGFPDSRRLCDADVVEIIEERHWYEPRLPTANEIESDKEGTHYAWDWLGVEIVYHGKINGRRPWKHQVKKLRYLGVPISAHDEQPSKQPSGRRPSKA